MDSTTELDNKTFLGTVIYPRYRELQEAEVYEDKEGYLVARERNGSKRKVELVEEGSLEYTRIEAALNGFNFQQSVRQTEEELGWNDLLDELQ